MDDADLAGPVLFCFCFGMVLLFVRLLPLGSRCRLRREPLSRASVES